MSTLDEQSLRAMLPQPNTIPSSQSGVVETEPPGGIPGAIVNTNPPYQNAGDALLFDPDENITYDPLQLLPRTTDTSTTSMTFPPAAPPSSGNILDLQPTQPPETSGSFRWQFWIMIIAGIIAVVLAGFLLMRSRNKSSSVPQQPQMSQFDQFYQ